MVLRGRQIGSAAGTLATRLRRPPAGRATSACCARAEGERACPAANSACEGKTGGSSCRQREGPDTLGLPIRQTRGGVQDADFDVTNVETPRQGRPKEGSHYGTDAEFRPGQLDAITALVRDRRRSWWSNERVGKSAVYFIATRLMRDLGAGPTLIVSPLLALMRDQMLAAERLGLKATTLNSSNSDDWDDVEREILSGRADLLLVAPERFNNPRFRDNVLDHLLGQAGLFVIDEAHCISDWGHDFRPDYRRLARVAALLPPGVPVLATTATANDRVVNDIEEQLGPRLLTLRGSLSRESLDLSALRLDSQAARLAWLAETFPQLPGTGNRLRPHRSRRQTTVEVVQRKGHPSSGLRRVDGQRGAARGGGRSAHQHGESRVRHQRPGDGVR